MRQRRGRIADVESLEEFDARLLAGATSLAGWRVSGVDLSERADALTRVSLAGATFLGCSFAPGAAHRATTEGALVLPEIRESPVDTYRARLYTADELYDTAEYAATLDARAYAWSQGLPGHTSTEAELAQTLHDHAIDEALRTWAAPRRLVGVMGGHAWRRGRPEFGDAARLGHLLSAAGCCVATGGGPGAMEAANLGGWLAAYPPEAVEDAVALLAEVPDFRPSVEAWVRQGRVVRDRFPGGGESLAIPTWHYGHEPPNVFGTAIAKYFRNAVREAVLLELSSAGIVFLPGAGGTVQEVFTDACENYYADEADVAPMVLVGADYWTRELPAWPLLRSLAAGRPMDGHVHLVDSVAEAVALFER